MNAVQAGKLAARSIIETLGVGAGRIVPVRPTDATVPGVDLFTDMAGIRSPNPFWLASCPITNTGEMVARAFDAGWGGVVWKTVGEQITNVTSRLGSLNFDGRRIVGMSNIELISDRPPEVNFAEIAEVKRRYPNQAVVVSLMVESKPETWYDFVGRVNDTGADGIELNFGCPHGMSERGMGAAVGQVPEYVQMITEWVMEKAAVPVLVKLTPNVTDIRPPARAARAAGANGIALINTVSSLIGVNLDTWAPVPDVRGKGSHGGFSGPAVKPIALNMTSAVASDPDVRLPISAIGGIADWHDAVEFMLVGATTVQVGTSVMHWGYRLIDDLVDGMSTYLRSKGLHSPAELVGKVAADARPTGAISTSRSGSSPRSTSRGASTATSATPPATTAPTRRSASRARTARPGCPSTATTASAAACAPTSARSRAASGSRSWRARPPSTDNAGGLRRVEVPSSHVYVTVGPCPAIPAATTITRAISRHRPFRRARRSSAGVPPGATPRRHQT